ncbi:hypothetical protein ScPMuIL_009483 [Solemya velum]
MWADYANFGKALGTKELPRLDKMGFQYRVAPPGAIIRNGYLMANTEFPTQVAQVLTNNGSYVDVGSQLYVGPVRTPLTLRTRTKAINGASKYSRNVLMDPTLVLPTPAEIAAANAMQRQAGGAQMQGQMPPGQMPQGRQQAPSMSMAG